jgi:membrane protease YdiL (CAAX protease family)
MDSDRSQPANEPAQPDAALTAAGDQSARPAAEPGRAGGDRSGGDRSGGDLAGGDRSGGDLAGGDRAGGDRAGLPAQPCPAEAGGIASEPIVEAEWVGPQASDRPTRWWTTLLVVAVSGFLFLTTASVVQVIAFASAHGADTALMGDPEAWAEAIEQLAASRWGLFVLLVVPQLTLLVPPLVAAWYSPVEFRERLGLVRGRWPLWAWVAGAFATPLVGLISGLITGLFLEESESLKQMSGIFREHGKSGFLIPLAMMIGATPAICEELLFRGFVQTRMVRSLGPLVGVTLASALFAMFHLDLVHVIAVFPLGLFLGWLAWQSDSIFPAMLGHFVNNAISVVAVVVAPEGQTDVLSLPTAAVSLLVISAGIIGMTAVAIAAVWYGRPAGVVPTT